jgi:hypothetical protein
MVDLAAVDDNQTKLPTEEATPMVRTISDADARLAARLKQFLNTPGISDKDRKLVERNLERLLRTTVAG